MPLSPSDGHSRRLLPSLTRLAACALLALGLGLPAASADAPPPLPGAERPAFQNALDLWLQDDEAQALPALAELAERGNAAARLLLAQIDKIPSLQGPYLAQMPRAERIALLRAPGGLSGRSWIAEIEDVAVADAWRALHWPDAGPELMARFDALGEPRAARTTMVVLAAREHEGLRDLPLDEADPELLYLLWRSAGPERRAEIAARVPAGHPQRQLMGEATDARDLDRWLHQSAAAAPLVALCNTLCPEDGEAGTCLGAAYQALGSHDALLTIGTPSEALIDQDRFLASPRGQASVMRRILLGTTMRGRRLMLARVEGQSACLAAGLSAEADRHRRVIPGVTPRP